MRATRVGWAFLVVFPLVYMAALVLSVGANLLVGLSSPVSMNLVGFLISTVISGKLAERLSRKPPRRLEAAALSLYCGVVYALALSQFPRFTSLFQHHPVEPISFGEYVIYGALNVIAAYTLLF